MDSGFSHTNMQQEYDMELKSDNIIPGINENIRELE